MTSRWFLRTTPWGLVPPESIGLPHRAISHHAHADNGESVAIFEHRPSRDSGRRRQADLSLHEESEGSPEDLLDLPLDGGSDDLELGPTAAETLPIPTYSEGPPPSDASSPDPGEAEEASRASSWGPTVRSVRGMPPTRQRTKGGPSQPRKGANRRPPETRRHPETIGQTSGGGRWLWILLFLALPLAVAAGYFLNRDPAVAQLSTELVDFGELRLGEVVQEAFEITNQGQQTLQVEGFELMGGADADFVVAGEDCVGRPLAQGETCRVRLAFRPSDSGPRKARLAVRSSSAAGLRTLPLLGAGASPLLELNPPQLDFSQHVVGTAAAPQVVWLSNGGSAPLEVERIRLAGLGAADFVLRQDECSRQQLEPGQRCALRLVFVPTAVGERRATVEVVSDAENSQNSQLQGIGLPQEPELRLAPERLEMAATALGDMSPAQVIEIFNDGNGPLQIHDLRPRLGDGTPGDGTLGDGAPGDGAPAGVFELQQEDCTGDQVAPGEGCRLEIVFRPRQEGEVSGFFEILHSAGEGRHLLPLVGEGLAPHLSLEPRRMSFGETALGGLSGSRTLLFTSSGSAPLRVDQVALEGADARAFEIEPVACLESDLPAGTTCALEVRFRPRRDGPHRSELVVRHNADPGEERLPLNGLGTSPKLELDASQLDFGDAQVGASAERTLTLSNSGRAPLAVRRLGFSGQSEGFELLEDGCRGRRLEASSRCQIRVRFAPTRPGLHASSLRIEHSAGENGLEVPLRGTANAPPPPRLGMQPKQFDFAPLSAGQRSAIRTLMLQNSGQGELSISDVKLIGPHPDAFILVPGTCAGGGALRPREDCTVGVRFAPSSGGIFEASIEVQHNGPQGTQRISLRGQGSAP